MRRMASPIAVGAVVGLLAALIILGPALKPGFLLHYDMVFVPHLGLGERTLGIDGAAGRAVPNDLVVALASQVLPGWLVQKLLLVLVFVAAGAGAGALMPGRRAAAVAAVVATWNPWVGERLAIGHWGYLLGYAALFWVIFAAGRCRRGITGPGLLGFVMMLAGLCGSTAALLSAILATAVLLVGPRETRAVRAWLWAMLISFLVAAAWWFPFLRSPASGSADIEGVNAFAARADTPLGVIASVMTGGGIWNQGAWFAERQSVVLSVVALLAVLLVVTIAWRDPSVRARPEFAGAAAAGLFGLTLASLGAIPGGRELVAAVVLHFPGGGLIRDGQKFAALWLVAVALAAGLATVKLGQLLDRRGAGRFAASAVCGACALVAVVTLPGVAFGAMGRWDAVDYPVDMTFLAERINEAEPGGVAVMPWTLYRKYDWNDNRVVLDPWQRLVDRDVRVSDTLPLVDSAVAGDDPRAAQVDWALRSADVAAALKSIGVRYLLIQKDQPGPNLPEGVFENATLKFETKTLQWWDLGTDGLELVQPATSTDRAGLWLSAVGVSLSVAGLVWLRRPRKSNNLSNNGGV